jgi:predicted Zn-ribbon and HTH transcriptional regulator
MTKAELIAKLQSKYPRILIETGEKTAWSPKNKCIVIDNIEHKDSLSSVLHEYGHALLKHKDYNSDMQLLKMELEAWEKAKKISPGLGIVLDQDYIENCLDTYRDWVHRRSKCPTCHSHGIQKKNEYQCFNCKKTWVVTNSRLSRTYRKKQK